MTLGRGWWGCFFDVGGDTERFRCDFYGVMSELLEESAYRRLYEWHEAHGLEYGTVAVRGRQDMLAQTNHFGDLFRLLRWYHFPGNEDPQLDEAVPVWRRFIDCKLSSPAAHIFGHQRAAVCGPWGAGWGARMDQLVAWSNEVVSYGINLFDPGAFANMQGGAG